MDFGLYCDAASGHLYGGVWTEPPPGCSQPVERLYVTCHRYNVVNTAVGAALGDGGFFDPVNVPTGEVARHWLALDQGMIMAAIANALGHDRLQRYLAPSLEPAVRPLLAAEQVSAR